MVELMSAPSSDPECGPNVALFPSGESAKKPLICRTRQTKRRRCRMKNSATTRNRSVDDLLGSRCWKIRAPRNAVELCPGCKTEKTTTDAITTMRNWNVHVLLHKPVQRGVRYDRRHFHQLFRRLLRETHTAPARLTGWMATSRTCSGMRTSSCRHTSTSWLSICGTGTSSDGTMSVDNLFHGAPLIPLLRPDASEAVRLSPFGVLVKQIGEHRRPSSGFVKCRTSRALRLGTKSGAGLRPTPCARSSARVAATSGAGAPVSALLRSCQCREQRKPSSPARVLTRKDTHKREGNFGSNALFVVVVVVVVVLKKL